MRPPYITATRSEISMATPMSWVTPPVVVLSGGLWQAS
jgi:hypothetical protein